MKRHQSAILGQRLGNGTVLMLTLIGALLSILPMYLMLSMAFKTPEEIVTTTPWEWPASPTWENFRYVLTNPLVPFVRLFLNTLFITAVSTVGTVLSCAVTAYVFARLKFRGRDRLFIVLLSTMMLPGAVTMIPSYQLWAALQATDTWIPLTLPSFFAGAFFVFLIRQFLMGIPQEMDEAALMDGASELRIFWSILLPNMKPALATVAVFTFMGTWRDFLGPLLYLDSPDKQTLELGLRTFQTLMQTDWHYIMAGAVITTTPLVIIFLFCQRYFVKGIALTGGK